LWRGDRVTSSDVPSSALVVGKVAGLGALGYWWIVYWWPMAAPSDRRALTIVTMPEAP